MSKPLPQIKRVRSWLQVISWLVPGELRDEWRETWLAEFRAWHSNAGDGYRGAWLRRLLGALSHALWLRANQWRPTVMLQDLNYGFRQLSRNLAFTLTAVAVLAVGIGSTTTVFTFLNGLLLRPLPVVSEPDRLVSVWRTQDGQGSESVSYPVFEYYRDNNAVLDGLAAFASRTFPATRGDSIWLLEGLLVSEDYFNVLGVAPVLGNPFGPKQQDPFAVLISHRLWEESFGGNPAILGQTLKVRGHSLEIRGILPEGFRGTDRLSGPDLWLPIGLESQLAPSRWGSRLEQPDLSWLYMIGRLRPELSQKQAEQSLEPLAANLRQLYPQNGDAGIELRSATGLEPEARREAQLIASLLMGSVGLLLLISCANVSSLVLARNGMRVQELGVRLALGAGRLRLVRQLLAESAILALLAAAAAVLVAYWSGALMVRLFSNLYGVSLSIDATPDQRVFFFALGLSLLSMVLIGLGPALKSSRSALTDSLRPGGGRLTVGKKWRSWLVTGQFAVCVLVVTGGGLFLRTLQEMQAVAPGFSSQNVLVYSLFPDFLGVPQERGQVLYRQIWNDLQSGPDLRGVAISTTLPLAGGYESAGIETRNFPHINRPYLIAERNIIAGDFFETLSIPFLQGRSFSRQDSSNGTPVAIVSSSLAERLWPGQEPLGQTFDAGGESGLRVIGVVADIKHRDVREAPRLAFYRPLTQDYRGNVYLSIRSDRSPGAVDTRVKEVMTDLLPAHPLSVTPYSEMIGESWGQQRLLVQFSGIFSLTALLLTGIGLYGVIAFSVSRQAREIGIRCALGADRMDVVREVLREGFRVAILGAGLGFGLLLLLSQLVNLSGTLYGVTFLDPWTLFATLVILLTVGLFASLIPARRAAGIDPARALRSE